MKLLSKDADYCVADTHEVGMMNVLLINLNALFRKRFFVYRRSYKTFIVEVLIPIILVIIGFGFTKVEQFFLSPTRTLLPSVYPE
jgi:hypothetical protein